ncbi:MAG: 16S rRNA (cytosine(967)-C(5))-methyltransferase RsmB [Candidatus Baldrarchaeia archaeon]
MVELKLPRRYEYVVSVLSRVERRKIPLKSGLEDIFSGESPGWRIRSAVTAHVLGILRNYRLIDQAINLTLKKGSVHMFKPELRNILRVAVYDIHIRRMVPARTVTMVAVNLAKKILDNNAARLVNALLRQIEGFKIEKVLEREDKAEVLALKYSHPTWFVRYIMELLGEEETIKLLGANNSPAPVWIRVNTIKIDRDRLIKILEKEGTKVTLDTDLPEVLKVVESKKPPVRLSSFSKGLFYIQDKASVLAGHVLNPKPGELIVDVCAAPGGKTSHIAQLMENEGKIIAVDVSRLRMKALKNNMKRLGVKIVETKVMDARDIPKKLKIEADRVIVDPTCSSTGNFRSRPEVRLWVKKKDVKRFAKLQWEILRAAAEIVKENGVLVYSTCSMTLEENEYIIKKFIENTSSFKIVRAEPFIGRPGFNNLMDAQRLFPYLHNTEGFFIAKLVKIG